METIQGRKKTESYAVFTHLSEMVNKGPQPWVLKFLNSTVWVEATAWNSLQDPPHVSTPFPISSLHSSRSDLYKRRSDHVFCAQDTQVAPISLAIKLSPRPTRPYVTPLLPRPPVTSCTPCSLCCNHTTRGTLLPQDFALAVPSS